VTGEGAQEVHQAVLSALLDAASPDGGSVQVCFRIFLRDGSLVPEPATAEAGCFTSGGVTRNLPVERLL
jgi:hypothetical protein